MLPSKLYMKCKYIFWNVFSFVFILLLFVSDLIPHTSFTQNIYFLFALCKLSKIAFCLKIEKLLQQNTSFTLILASDDFGCKSRNKVKKLTFLTWEIFKKKWLKMVPCGKVQNTYSRSLGSYGPKITEIHIYCWHW